MWKFGGLNQCISFSQRGCGNRVSIIASRFVAWLPRVLVIVPTETTYCPCLTLRIWTETVLIPDLKKKLATITDVSCISYFSFIIKHVKQGSKRVKDLRSRALSDLKRSWALETSAALGPKALELGRSPAPAISLNLIEPSNRSLTHK